MRLSITTLLAVVGEIFKETVPLGVVVTVVAAVIGLGDFLFTPRIVIACPCIFPVVEAISIPYVPTGGLTIYQIEEVAEFPDELSVALTNLVKVTPLKLTKLGSPLVL